MMRSPLRNPSPWSRRREAGFSLVEVTIAMAIAAVAVVTLLGMIPQGMNTMQVAGDQAIEGRIHQQILNELQMTSFQDKGGGEPIREFNGREFYYDSQGEEIGDSKEKSDAKGSFEHIYTARVTIMDSNGGGKAPDSVGGSNFGGFSFDKGGTVNGELRQVIIEIAAVSGLAENFDWSDEQYREIIHTHQTTVVDMGQDYQ